MTQLSLSPHRVIARAGALVLPLALLLGVAGRAIAAPAAPDTGGFAVAAATPVGAPVVTLRAANAPPQGRFFSPVESQWRRLVGEADRVRPARPTPEDALALLRAGRVEEARELLGRLLGDPRAADVARARVLLTHVSLGELRPVLDRIAALPSPDERERWVLYQGLSAHDDVARVDAITRRRILAGEAGAPEWLAAGRLAYDLLDYDRADSLFDRALSGLGGGVPLADGALDTAAVRATALTGQALVLQKRRDWDGSLARLQQAIAAQVSPDVLQALTETLIRLGRTDEAIGACEWAVLMNPCSDAAHYMLGNGYARKNYTELMAAHPAAFADAAGRTALATADGLLAAGRRAQARAAYEALARRRPGWVDVRVRLASLDFEDGRYAEARRRCFEALAIEPGYGRAHAVLAKALESQRFEADVHRADYERRFAAAPSPEVPGIERFVLNWESLSPRHRKRVALSIAPWKHYLPVLIEGGATYHIKPLYMLLSETPGQQTLRDQRISYDSRLWDDVRGAGGYHTVTGIEDVERTIFDRYNTVLHELTHQVHAVLTADQGREIQELYRRAKARDDSTRDGFLSRYAGGSVWEYFAEGANALESPRRDAYDPREVVRERLERLDPGLLAHVRALFARRDVEASYPVAYVNAGDDRVQQGKVDEALPFYRKALARAPREESALLSLTNALVLGNRGGEALAAAESALAAHPGSGGIVTAAATAYRHGGRGLQAARALLERSRATVRAEDRYQLDLARGGLAWAAGDAAAALAAYDSVLAYQSDQPEGLWGRAAALALAPRWDDAFPAYDRAVRMRTGVVGLRCDYARDLLRAGRTAEAGFQLDEARLLDAEHPTAEALRAWAELARGDAAAAKRRALQALAWGPWSDLARIVLGRAEQALGDAAAAETAWAPVRRRIAGGQPPEYVYRPRIAAWEVVHELPAVERGLLPDR